MIAPTENATENALAAVSDESLSRYVYIVRVRGSDSVHLGVTDDVVRTVSHLQTSTEEVVDLELSFLTRNHLEFMTGFREKLLENRHLGDSWFKVAESETFDLLLHCFSNSMPKRRVLHAIGLCSSAGLDESDAEAQSKDSDYDSETEYNKTNERDKKRRRITCRFNPDSESSSSD
jgi:hypothetical protein